MQQESANTTAVNRLAKPTTGAPTKASEGLDQWDEILLALTAFAQLHIRPVGSSFSLCLSSYARTYIAFQQRSNLHALLSKSTSDRSVARTTSTADSTVGRVRRSLFEGLAAFLRDLIYWFSLYPNHFSHSPIFVTFFCYVPVVSSLLLQYIC